MSLCVALMLVIAAGAVTFGAKRRRAPTPGEELRFLHYRCGFRGQPISAVDLELEEKRRTLCVTYVGRIRCQEEPLGTEQLLPLLGLLVPLSGGWRSTGERQGCLAFGVGPLTVDGVIPCSPDDPVLRRFQAVVKLESLRLALVSELSFARTDDPSLAASSIATIVKACESRRIVPDREIRAHLRELLADKSLSPLVRRAAAAGLLRLFGEAPAAGGADPLAEE